MEAASSLEACALEHATSSSLWPHSVVKSQPGFKGWGNRLHFLMGELAKYYSHILKSIICRETCIYPHGIGADNGLWIVSSTILECWIMSLWSVGDLFRMITAAMHPLHTSQFGSAMAKIKSQTPSNVQAFYF